jgi:hypothetical protein
MATPKGMRAQQFPVNDTDAVHVYSDDTHIWVQLRGMYRLRLISGGPHSSSRSVCSPGPPISGGLN